MTLLLLAPNYPPLISPPRVPHSPLYSTLPSLLVPPVFPPPPRFTKNQPTSSGGVLSINFLWRHRKLWTHRALYEFLDGAPGWPRPGSIHELKLSVIFKFFFLITLYFRWYRPIRVEIEFGSVRFSTCNNSTLVSSSLSPHSHLPLYQSAHPSFHPFLHSFIQPVPGRQYNWRSKIGDLV